MEINYRKLNADEAPLYRAIRLESLEKFPDAFGASYQDEVDKPKLWFETLIAQQLADKFMFGAFDNGTLIGICGFIKEEQARSSHRSMIIQMYVNQHYAGNNVGLNLLNAALTVAFKLPGLELVTLGVIADNVAANKIYEKAGFVEYGFLGDYYKNGNRSVDQRFMVLTKKSFIENI